MKRVVSVNPHLKQVESTQTSSENEQSSLKELDSWKQSVLDSEKGSDSDNGNLVNEERSKRKRRSLRKAKSKGRKTESDGSSEQYCVNVRTPESDLQRNQSIVIVSEGQDSTTNSRREPTGLPPMAPKKQRRRSDGRSPRRRHKSTFAF